MALAARATEGQPTHDGKFHSADLPRLKLDYALAVKAVSGDWRSEQI
jgi:hypothetical protein